MGRRRITTELYIYMNGHKVGALVQSSVGRLELKYAQEWLNSEVRRPLSLSLPLSTHKHSGVEVENFFDNLLPDSAPIRNRIQARFGLESNKSFDLLSCIGRDCIGAVQLLPSDVAPDVKSIDAEVVTEKQIARILRNYTTMPLGMKSDTDFRISMAGAQEKTAFLRMEDAWYRPSGATPTTHILKLPIGRIEHSDMDLSDSVENEWLCHLILKAYGIPVADAEMATFDTVKALVVKRFDRRWSEDRSWIIRLPQEDMCQALGVSGALKYESDGGPGIVRIMELLQGSSQALADRRKFMTMQVLFWILGAIDGHAKNFSIFLLPAGGFELTPAYDVLSAYPLIEKGQLEKARFKMAMGIKGKNRHYRWDKIVKRHWLSMARASSFPESEMEQIINDISDRMDDVIAEVASSLPPSFPADVCVPVLEGMRQARDRLSTG